MNALRRLLDRSNLAGLWVTGALAAYQGIFVLRYALEVPFTDEWNAMEPVGLAKELSLRYLDKFENEHCLMLTRLVTWLSYRVADGEPMVAVCFNYGLFLGACGTFYALLRSLRIPGVALLLPALAWPMPYDVHAWGFQTHFYGTLLLFFSALWVTTQGRRTLWLAAPLGILAVFSFGSGVALACALAGVAGVLALWEPERRTAHCLNATALMVALGAYMALRRTKPWLGHDHHFTRPWRREFWAYATTLLAKPFGWDQQAPVTAGTLILVALVASLAALLLTAWRQRSASKLALGGAVLGILGSAFGITLGRAAFGLWQAHDARYTSYTLFLVSMLWAMQVILARRWPLYLGGVFLLLILPLLPRLEYEGPYSRFHADNMAGKRCIWDYYLGENDGCPALLPWYPTGPRLDRAWELNMAFVQEFKQMNAGTPTRYDRPAPPDA